MSACLLLGGAVGVGIIAVVGGIAVGVDVVGVGVVGVGVGVIAVGGLTVQAGYGCAGWL